MDSLTEEWQKTVRKWQACTTNTSCGPHTTKLSKTIRSRMHHCEPSLATFRESEALSSGSPIVELENIVQALETFMGLHVFIEGVCLGLGHASSGHGASLGYVERGVNAACKELREILSLIIVQGVGLLNTVSPAVETEETDYQTQWLRAREGKKAALQVLERLEERRIIDSEQALPASLTPNQFQTQSQELVASDPRAHSVEIRRPPPIRGTSIAVAPSAGATSGLTKRRLRGDLDVQSPREDSVGLDLTNFDVRGGEQRGPQPQPVQSKEISSKRSRSTKKPQTTGQKLLDFVSGQGEYPRRSTTPKVRRTSRSSRFRRLRLGPG